LLFNFHHNYFQEKKIIQIENLPEMTTEKPLSEEQIEQYWKEGYIVVPQLISGSVIDSVLEASAKTERAGGDDQNWQYAKFEHNNPMGDPALHAILVDANVVAAVEQILEAPARVFYGMLAVVPAKGGNGLPWHQDNQYQHLMGKALNTFVALCDITPDKAILWVAPKSHLKGLLDSTDSEQFKGHKESLFEPPNGMPLPTMKKGDVCIFTRYTLHRSLKNNTSDDRHAYAAQYMEDTARDAVSGKKLPERMLASDLAQMFSAVSV